MEASFQLFVINPSTSCFLQLETNQLQGCMLHEILSAIIALQFKRWLVLDVVQLVDVVWNSAC